MKEVFLKRKHLKVIHFIGKGMKAIGCILFCFGCCLADSNSSIPLILLSGIGLLLMFLGTKVTKISKAIYFYSKSVA